MNYTISDFYQTFQRGIKLLAGAGGMARIVGDAGILDYEMDVVLKDKYFHSNFHENQLVVTTFLCAKENPFLIGEAVKHLIAKGTSGLVIKNVFRLPIHESVLRYADSKNFPIFTIEAQDIFMERIIYEVSRHCELMADLRYGQNKLDEILFGQMSGQELITCVRQINPSCKEQFFSIYVKFGDFLGNTDFEQMYRYFLDSDLNTPGNFLILRENSIFYIHSEEGIAGKYSDSLISYILEVLLQGRERLCCGVSRYHLTLEEFKMSLEESIYAAEAGPPAGASFMKYGQLGVFRFLFPFAQTRELQQYAQEVLQKIEDHDIENNSVLLETLCRYIEFDCNLIEAARDMGQHKNTIRYRLDKIHELTGLDYKRFSHLEQLSAAIKIRQCSK